VLEVEIMHNSLSALGIVLLVIGLGASFYYESKSIFGIEYQRTYPYQNLGIALIVVGVILLVVGVLYSPRKEEKTEQTALASSSQPIPRGKFCSQCGKLVSIEAKFCPNCGKGLKTD